MKIRLHRALYAIHTGIWRAIDMRNYIDVFSAAAYIRVHSRYAMRRHGQAEHQSRASQGAAHPQPPPRARARPLVPDRHLLRRARSRASQIRDAPPCQSRGCLQGRGRRALWPVSPGVLSSSDSARSRRARRIAAASAWAEGRAQAYRRDYELYRTAPVRGSPRLHARALAEEIKAALHLSVHPRSIERALARKKKLQNSPPR